MAVVIPEAMEKGLKMPPSVQKHVSPWWAWVMISIGLAEAAWFGQTVVAGSQQRAATQTEIGDIQREQAALSTSLSALDTDVQALNVSVAVLTQRIADREQHK